MNNLMKILTKKNIALATTIIVAASLLVLLALQFSNVLSAYA